MRTRRGGTVGRFVDQIAWSFVTFGIAGTSARWFRPREFGTTAILLAMIQVAGAVAYGGIGEPTLGAEDLGGPESPIRTVEALSLSTVLAAASAVAAAVVASLISAATPGTAAAIGLAAGSTLLAAAVRVRMQAHRLDRAMLCYWVPTIVVLGLCLVSRTITTTSSLAVSYSACQLCCAVLGLRSVRFWRLQSPLGWHRHHGRRLASGLVESLVTTGSLPILMLVVAGISGGVVAGNIQTATVLYGLISIAVIAGRAALLPEARLAYRNGTQAVREMVLRASNILMLVTVAMVAVVLLIPDPLGHRLLGSRWMAVSPLLLPFGVHRIASALSSGPALALRAMDRWVLPARIRAGSALATMVAGTAAALSKSAVAIGWALAITASVSAALWWAMLRRQMAADLGRSTLLAVGPPVPIQPTGG